MEVLGVTTIGTAVAARSPAAPAGGDRKSRWRSGRPRKRNGEDQGNARVPIGTRTETAPRPLLRLVQRGRATQTEGKLTIGTDSTQAPAAFANLFDEGRELTTLGCPRARGIGPPSLVQRLDGTVSPHGSG